MAMRTLSLAWMCAALVKAQDDTAAIRVPDKPVSDADVPDDPEQESDSDSSFGIEMGFLIAFIVLLISTYGGYVIYTWHQNKVKKEQEQAEAEGSKGVVKEPAPTGWYAGMDTKLGRPFFHNTETKERCWKDPRTRTVRTAAFVHNLHD